MTAITDGLITEADRLALVNAIIEERGTQTTTHQLVTLALKVGVTPDTLMQAAQFNDEGALANTDVTERIRGWLGECG
jgi:uncharacterized membrane protein YebE (DUF533 family)